MDLGDLLTPDRVISHLAATSKKQVLRAMSAVAGEACGADPKAILDALLARERQGGTGMNGGVAIPHAHIEGLERPLGVFARIEPAIDFDAMDGVPADLVFMLLASKDKSAEHLKALARIARAFRSASICEQVRGAESSEAIHTILTSTLRDAA